MHAAEWLIYGLGLPSAKENHHDTWNTVQDLCLFVSNQEMFAIKRCAQQSGAFKFFSLQDRHNTKDICAVPDARIWDDVFCTRNLCLISDST